MVKREERPDPALWQRLKPHVQQLRKGQTPAERKLWAHLRGRRFDGIKFRRQVAIGRFVVDFFCGQADLIIEVDGAVHQSQVSEDLERQQALESLGFQVLRFTNEQVIQHTEQVLDKISGYLETNGSPNLS